MSFFKDPQNNLHFLDDDAFEYLLPEGSVLITDAEAEEIQATATARASASPAAIIAQMDALDGGGQARAVRLGLIAMLPAGDQLTRLQALETQVAALRAQLVA